MKCAAMWSEGTATVRRVQVACVRRNSPNPDPTLLSQTAYHVCASKWQGDTTGCKALTIVVFRGNTMQKAATEGQPQRGQTARSPRWKGSQQQQHFVAWRGRRVAAPPAAACWRPAWWPTEAAQALYIAS